VLPSTRWWRQSGASVLQSSGSTMALVEGGQEGAPLVEGKESTRYALAAVVGEMTRDVEADTVSMTRGTRGNEENRGSQHT
jgi:hypothetical protein